MRFARFALLLFAVTVRPVAAQSEESLRAYFEGKSVVVKIEMPGSENGVDVYPGRLQPIDFRKHAGRLKDYGTAIRRGDLVLITKVKLKDDLIEFQLGGGGYGTFGDDTDPHVNVPSAPKTQRERNLEKDLEKTTDPVLRRKIREEIDALRKGREREDARNRARVAEAQQIKEANIRQRRLESGSRFNIRYDSEVPSEALRPDGIMRALAEYVDFAPLAARTNEPTTAVRPDDLRKGLTVVEVDALLGRPISISERAEGTLTVQTSTYRRGDRTISAEFVEGVLIRFTIRSQ
jgi:hypothetical protein